MLLMYNLNTGESFSTIPEVEIDNSWKLSPSGTMLLEALTGSRSIVIYDLYGDCFQLQFQDVIMSASWTYQLQEDGAMKEHIVACLMREETTAIVLIEPITGEVVATVYEGDQGARTRAHARVPRKSRVFYGVELTLNSAFICSFWFVFASVTILSFSYLYDQTALFSFQNPFSSVHF